MKEHPMFGLSSLRRNIGHVTHAAIISRGDYNKSPGRHGNEYTKYNVPCVHVASWWLINERVLYIFRVSSVS